MAPINQLLWLFESITGPLSDLGGLSERVGLLGCVLSLCALSCIALVLWLKLQWTAPPHTLTTEEWAMLLDLTKAGYLHQNKTRVMTVLKSSLDVNEYSDPINGLTLLLCACLSGQLDLVTTVLNKGADVKALTVTGHSALSLTTFACCTIKSTDTKQLLDMLACQGVDVNQQDSAGNPALSIAALYGRADIASLLLQYGADPELCGVSRVRAWDLALETGHGTVARMIESHAHH